MKQPKRVLDLFCGAGGAAMGLHQAWPDAEIVGIDINPQPNYPFNFEQGDALGRSVWFYMSFDFIWASPPCQAHTTLKVMHNARMHPDLIPLTRPILELRESWAMENVVGAPLLNPTRLCGSSFGLGVEVYDGWRQLRRHRLFETPFALQQPKCQHSGVTIGLYGDHARDRRRKPGVRERGIDFPDCNRLQLGRDSMQMPWAKTWKEVCQAIPPAYSRYIAEQWSAQQK